MRENSEKFKLDHFSPIFRAKLTWKHRSGKHSTGGYFEFLRKKAFTNSNLRRIAFFIKSSTIIQRKLKASGGT